MSTAAGDEAEQLARPKRIRNLSRRVMESMETEMTPGGLSITCA